MSQSDRATGRVRDLRSLTLQRLRNHSPLTDRLAYVASVSDGADVIMPAFTADKRRRDDGAPDPPDITATVSVVTGSSTRLNRQERVNLTVQVGLEMTADTLGTRQDGHTLGLAWHDALRDGVSAVMTAQVAEWEAGGETGGTPEPLWDDSINRYRSVQRFDVSRFD
ncbi:hypothetical protein [Halostella sp. PRR32]|uniref:hypothetical protein n=1 Tax=Halostella sp. PRR32 TaxID=3098147 RepID=UPI002B1D72B8|nr:hypothetical protein [Halostella sp. PRR32]